MLITLYMNISMSYLIIIMYVPLQTYLKMILCSSPSKKILSNKLGTNLTSYFKLIKSIKAVFLLPLQINNKSSLCSFKATISIFFVMFCTWRCCTILAVQVMLWCLRVLLYIIWDAVHASTSKCFKKQQASTWMESLSFYTCFCIPTKLLLCKKLYMYFKHFRM